MLEERTVLIFRQELASIPSFFPGALPKAIGMFLSKLFSSLSSL
jgi:hypothetical protein